MSDRLKQFEYGDTVRFKPEYAKRFGDEPWVVEGTVPYDGSVYSKLFKRSADPRMLEMVKKAD